MKKIVLVFVVVLLLVTVALGILWLWGSNNDSKPSQEAVNGISLSGVFVRGSQLSFLDELLNLKSAPSGNGEVSSEGEEGQMVVDTLQEDRPCADGERNKIGEDDIYLVLKCTKTGSAPSKRVLWMTVEVVNVKWLLGTDFHLLSRFTSSVEEFRVVKVANFDRKLPLGEREKIFGIKPEFEITRLVLK